MSGNPFRRSQAPPARLPPEAEQPLSKPDTFEDGDSAVAASPPKTKNGKPKKRVQIISPPQSPLQSHDRPRRLSDGQTGSPPPPPVTVTAEDARESAATTAADEDLQEAFRNTRRNSEGADPLSPPFPETGTMKAPYNPFARTLATTEASFGLNKAVSDDKEQARQSVSGPPKINMDMFKNILMTGSASPSPPVSLQTQPQRPPDSSSSNTDASSLSRHSLFDPAHEAHLESPRTSFDQPSSPEDDDHTEQASLMGPLALRPDAEGPPPPPKHRHGKAIGPKGPQTVSFADFDESVPSGWQGSGLKSPSARSESPRASILRPSTPRSTSDLNKPLPAPPAVMPAPQPVVEKAQPLELDLDGPTPVVATLQNEASQAKKPPPPPPASRRQGQATQGRIRSSSNLTQSSIVEEEDDPEAAAPKPSIPPSTSKPPPPPPPTRRAHNPSQPSPPAEGQSHSEEGKPVPLPPPRRTHSKSNNSFTLTRNSSTSSRSSLTKIEHIAPPAPPPRRAGAGNRNSFDGAARRLSGQHDLRRTSGQSVGSETSSLRQVDESESLDAELERGEKEKGDVLADLAKLQAEVDALRAKAGKG